LTGQLFACILLLLNFSHFWYYKSNLIFEAY
jgi:hypothetical protein